MSRQFTASESRILDDIIKNRRSVRQFKKDPLTEELITTILTAGLWAPYAALAVSTSYDFRQFYVIPQGSEKLVRINDTIKEFSKGLLNQFEQQMNANPFVRENGKNFYQRLMTVVQEGVSGLIYAPCLIIVAEKKGFPPAEKQSLAHVMENMWLKSVSLNLGFRLLSIFENLNESKEFCEILGAEYGKYAFNGCIIGYPQNSPNEGKRAKLEEVVYWL